MNTSFAAKVHKKNSLLNTICDMFEDQFGFIPSRKFSIDVLADCNIQEDEIYDTDTKDKVYDSFSKLLCGTDWPRYGSNCNDISSFYEEMKDKYDVLYRKEHV